MRYASTALSKPAFTARPIAARRYSRAGFNHRHSVTEKITGGLAGALLITLVIIGLIYAVRLVPSPPAFVPDDAAVRFADTRAGRIVIPTDDGRCREYAFYNTTGWVGPERVLTCDEDLPRAPRTSGAGFESFKQAFGGKK
jgi:hypothetical protein